MRWASLATVQICVGGRASPVPVGALAYKVVSSLSIEMASGTIPLKRLSFRPLHSAPVYVPMLRGRNGKSAERIV